MQAEQFERALLALASWQLAGSNNVDELVAIACTIRNWVVPRPGVQRFNYKSYTEAIETFLQLYPVREFPRINEPALIDPADGILNKADRVYDYRLPDITASPSFPTGARVFCRAGGNEWPNQEVASRPGEHLLIGTFGAQQFYT